MRVYKVNKDKMEVYFTFPFNEAIIAEIKMFKLAVYNVALKTWVIPIKDNKYEIADFIAKWDFAKKEGDLVAKQIFNYPKQSYTNLKRKISKLAPPFEVRSYQMDSLLYGLEKRQFINAFDMGLGKTFVSSLTVELDNAFPCLVITPSSIKYQFAEAWMDYFKGRKISVIDTKNKKNDWQADVVVINYDILFARGNSGVKYKELLSTKWKGLIADEAHFIKKDTAKRSIVVKTIIDKMYSRYKSPLIQLLSGTLCRSKHKDFINPLKLIRKFDNIASSWFNYINLFCDANKSSFGLSYEGATNPIELNQRLRNNCMVRFDRGDVMGELPDITRNTIKCNISNTSDYRKAEADIYSYLLEIDKDKADASLNASHLVRLNTLKTLIGNGKIKACEQYLKDWKEGFDKLIIFGTHREPLIQLSQKFKCDAIIGGTSAEDKHNMVKRFIEGDNQFLFCNIKSAGTGIDGLQKVCNNVLFLEFDGSVPDEFAQAIARTHRSGQKNNVNVNVMVAQDTFDEINFKLLIANERKSINANVGRDDVEEFDVIKEIISNKK